MFVPSFVLVLICVLSATDADNYQVEEPTHCEVCKYFVVELQNRLEETGKSREILRTGHGLDTRNRKEFSYKTSELRLIEAMDGICEKILEYNVHKERTGSLRFSKGQSETMSTLHGLVNKGVKVELGIPYDLWDEPSVEVTILKKQCEQMLERHEESIEEWYFEHQDTDKLTDYLCKSVVLNKDNQSCLEEQWTGKEKKYQDEDQEDQGVVGERKKRKKRKKAAGKPKKEKKPKKGKSKGDNGSDSDSSDSPTSEKDEL